METAQRQENQAGLPAEFFSRMARAGALAPSGDNLQPWSFAVEGASLLLKHEATRDQSLFNVRHLASFIALGAALENIIIASSGEGYRANVACFPNGPFHKIVARLSFERGSQADPLAKFLGAR